MKKINSGWILLIALVNVSCSSSDEFDKKDTPYQANTDATMKGARTPERTMSYEVVAERIADIKSNTSFAQLVTVLNDNLSVSLDLENAIGLIYPESDILSVPLVDSADNSSVGQIVFSKEQWSVGIIRESIIETYRVDGNEDSQTIQLESVDTSIIEEGVDEHVLANEAIDAFGDSYSPMSCQYVSEKGFNIYCISDSNPFFLYYKLTTRVGYGDPSRPKWWACAEGFIHTCPQYEYGYWSPQVYSICGFAPRHAEGG